MEKLSTEASAAEWRAGVERLSNRVIWAYSVPRIGVGILGLLFATYLMKFATDVLLIAPAVMGGLILLVDMGNRALVYQWLFTLGGG